MVKDVDFGVFAADEEFSTGLSVGVDFDGVDVGVEDVATGEFVEFGVEFAVDDGDVVEAAGEEEALVVVEAADVFGVGEERVEETVVHGNK